MSAGIVRATAKATAHATITLHAGQLFNMQNSSLLATREGSSFAAAAACLAVQCAVAAAAAASRNSHPGKHATTCGGATR